MTSNNPAFVFIHGAWHSGHTWDKVVPILADRGYASVAIDLPGAGTNAQIPSSYNQRPLDPAAFGTEPSPNAGTTQDERNEATLAAMEEAAALGNGQVILVGHSLGGLTITPISEMAPEKVHAVVYLTAFLLPNGMVAGQMITDETMAEAMVPGLFMADPEVTGALRLDPKSEDADYVANARAAFYADLTDEDFAMALGILHPDEPAQVVGVPSNITAEKFGTVSRHYIRCTQDNAISIAGQDKMINLVDAELGNKTTTHTLEASHSPFFSQPEQLADVLVTIAS
ncbi:MAG: alpha/beta fold hydrolase [Chloroflexota bacterium]